MTLRQPARTPAILCSVLAVAGIAPAGTAAAAELALQVELPRLDVVEYHRPYLAVWLERPDGRVVAPLAVWYDLRMADGEGQKWLKDMRQWWRRIGRDLAMPADGISSATRPPGDHRLGFQDGMPPLGALAPGSYELVVEAAREVGGRELLRLPFQWPPEAAVATAAEGRHELGRIELRLKP